jgi:hypothetical protein
MGMNTYILNERNDSLEKIFHEFALISACDMFKYQNLL